MTRSQLFSQMRANRQKRAAVALAAEERVAVDRDGDDAVAGTARTDLAFALEAHLGAVLDPRRELEVDRLAVGERDALVGAPRGVDERHAQAIGEVGAFLRRRLPALLATEAAASERA